MNQEWPREEINPYRLFHFAQVPLWLLSQREITAGAKLLYGRLITFAGKDGRAYPTQRTLGNELGVSDRQIRYLVAELVEHRLIEAKRRDFAGPDHYLFLRHPWMDLSPATTWEQPN